LVHHQKKYRYYFECYKDEIRENVSQRLVTCEKDVKVLSLAKHYTRAQKNDHIRENDDDKSISTLFIEAIKS